MAHFRYLDANQMYLLSKGYMLDINKSPELNYYNTSYFQELIVDIRWEI